MDLSCNDGTRCYVVLPIEKADSMQVRDRSASAATWTGGVDAEVSALVDRRVKAGSNMSAALPDRDLGEGRNVSAGIRALRL